MRPVLAMALVACVAPLVCAQAPIGTAVTYQGRLKDAGAPGNASYDFEFKLYDDPAAGALIGTDTADDWPVQEGLFTVWLDFGVGAFNGQRRWLQIGVRPGASGGAYTTLTPRQELTPAPYGLYASTADTVDGFHAAAAPAANTLLPLNGATKFPNSVLMTGAGNGLDADLLDGQQGAFYQNASNLNAGTIADARLSSNVALLNNAQTFTGAKTFSTAPSFTAAGAPFSVTSGTLVTNLNSDFLDGQSGAFYQNSSNQNAGTLADARLSSNVALLNTEQTFTAIKHFTGDVSMGTTTAPQGTLDVRGGNMYFDTGGGNLFIRYAPTNDGWNFATSGSGANLWLREDPNDASPIARMVWTAGGNVGVGTTSPDVTLHVATGTDTEPGSGGYIVTGLITGANISIDNNEIMARNNGAVSTLYLNNDGGTVYVGGTTNTDILTIRGGADVAERFDVTDEVKPGMVVAIDPDQPGKMCLAKGAYNPRVAGIISGANELAAGMVLGEFAGCENAQPVALTGRVWTYCDASEKAIEPGDLLTTSDRAGYAMSAVNRERSHGAVIGKAMSRLAKGESGLVLVLVNLQ